MPAFNIPVQPIGQPGQPQRLPQTLPGLENRVEAQIPQVISEGVQEAAGVVLETLARIDERKTESQLVTGTATLAAAEKAAGDVSTVGSQEFEARGEGGVIEDRLAAFDQALESLESENLTDNARRQLQLEARARRIRLQGEVASQVERRSQRIQQGRVLASFGERAGQADSLDDVVALRGDLGRLRSFLPPDQAFEASQELLEEATTNAVNAMMDEDVLAGGTDVLVDQALDDLNLPAVTVSRLKGFASSRVGRYIDENFGPQALQRFQVITPQQGSVVETAASEKRQGLFTMQSVIANNEALFREVKGGAYMTSLIANIDTSIKRITAQEDSIGRVQQGKHIPGRSSPDRAAMELEAQSANETMFREYQAGRRTPQDFVEGFVTRALRDGFLSADSAQRLERMRNSNQPATRALSHLIVAQIWNENQNALDQDRVSSAGVLVDLNEYLSDPKELQRSLLIAGVLRDMEGQPNAVQTAEEFASNTVDRDINPDNASTRFRSVVPEDDVLEQLVATSFQLDIDEVRDDPTMALAVDKLKRLWELHYLSSENPTASRTSALIQMHKSWGKTSLGSGAFMQNPPEALLGNDEGYLNAEFTRFIQEFAQNPDVDESHIDLIQFPHPEIPGRFSYQLMVSEPGNPFATVMTDKSGLPLMWNPPEYRDSMSYMNRVARAERVNLSRMRMEIEAESEKILLMQAQEGDPERTEALNALLAQRAQLPPREGPDPMRPMREAFARRLPPDARIDERITDLEARIAAERKYIALEQMMPMLRRRYEASEDPDYVAVRELVERLRAGSDRDKENADITEMQFLEKRVYSDERDSIVEEIYRRHIQKASRGGRELP